MGLCDARHSLELINVRGQTFHLEYYMSSRGVVVRVARCSLFTKSYVMYNSKRERIPLSQYVRVVKLFSIHTLKKNGGHALLDYKMKQRTLAIGQTWKIVLYKGVVTPSDLEVSIIPRSMNLSTQ